jgi:uncharacterized protein YigE (DUF2233 family)
MNRRWLKRTWFALLGGVSRAALAGAERVEFAGTVYQLYRLDFSDQGSLELLWQEDDGRPLNHFMGLRRDLEKKGQGVVFAMNAGIFEQGPRPLGLTISAGKELVPLNLRSGEGNFFLKPNGVFFLDDTLGPGVMESQEFARSGIKPRLATQSGPLLLRHGMVHPAFNARSSNRRLRNGVGIRSKDGQIIFALSDREDFGKGRVTFYEFAEFFRNLGCLDALYLDGDISDMLIEPTADVRVAPNTFAGMLVITKHL